MRKKEKMKKEKGFILVFTLFLVAIMLLIVVNIANSTVSVLSSSSQHIRSLRASYAADAGLRCAVYLSENYKAFETTHPLTEYYCGINPLGSGGIDVGYTGAGAPPATCEKTHYTRGPFVLGNGSCVTLEVYVDPVTYQYEGSSVIKCDVRVYAHGKSSCSDGSAVVERTQWQSM